MALKQRARAAVQPPAFFNIGSGRPVSASSRRTRAAGAARLDELDLAFAVGERAYPDLRAATPAGVEARWLATIEDLQTTWPLFLPQTAPLRADPRFTDIVERVGLLDYWRESGHPPDFCETESAPVCALLRR